MEMSRTTADCHHKVFARVLHTLAMATILGWCFDYAATIQGQDNSGVASI